MRQIAPPPAPPRIALADRDGFQPLQLKLWLVWVTAVTVMITAWVVSLGPVPAVLAIVTAKHVLVAILAMGLEMNKCQEED